MSWTFVEYPGWVARLLTAVFFSMWALPVGADDLGPKDQKQIIQVVQAQLNAFAQDDAVKAFSYSAPNIKQLMGNAENFIELVRTRYQVVYRPISTSYMRPTGDAGEAVLKVRMTDADGDYWIATYTLQKQKNKFWRISGCAITLATGTMV